MGDELKIYTEIGFGNASFVSTEVEKGEREHRVRGFVRMKLLGIYLRIWIGKKVCVISSLNGFSLRDKPKNRIKILLGFEGRRR